MIHIAVFQLHNKHYITRRARHCDCHPGAGAASIFRLSSRGSLQSRDTSLSCSLVGPKRADARPSTINQSSCYLCRGLKTQVLILELQLFAVRESWILFSKTGIGSHLFVESSSAPRRRPAASMAGHSFHDPSLTLAG